MFNSAFMRFDVRFMYKLVTAVFIVSLGDFLLYQDHFRGSNFGLFMIALVGPVVARRQVRRDRRALAFAGLALLFAGAMIVDPSMLAFGLFWISIAVAVLLPTTGAFDDGWRWAQRLIGFTVKGLAKHIIDFLLVARILRQRPSRPMRHVVGSLALPLVGGAVFVALFAIANPLIEDILARIEVPVIAFPRLVVWALLATAAWRLLRPRRITPFFSTADGTGDLNMPGVNVVSVRLSLILFNLLFAIQNGLDVAFLWTGERLPAAFTFAEYAHRGAYPLIFTALLAGAFVIVVLRPKSLTASVPAIRRLLVLWIVQNIVLVASSALRTWYYIEAYSLTVLRIAALVWMGLVAIGLVLIAWRMLKGHSASWLINRNLAAAGIVLTVFAFVDAGELAARWNVANAREVGGSGVELDFCYLSRLGSSSLLPLVSLEQKPLAPAFHARVRAARQMVMTRLIKAEAEGYWTARDAARLDEARRLLGASAFDGRADLGDGCGCY